MIEKRDKGCRTILGIHFTEQCGTISYFFHFGIHFLSKCEKRLLWSNGKGNFMIYSKEGKHKKRRKSGLRRSLLMVLSEKWASIQSVYFLRCWGQSPQQWYYAAIPGRSFADGSVYSAEFIYWGRSRKTSSRSITNLAELLAMHVVWERFFPGSDTGCTFGEYIRKKSQKSSILQEDSCGNTALNKEKRNFRKKIQFVPPSSHSKRGTKRRFSHICSFETCKYTDSVKFRRKWITKSKKSHIVPHYLKQPFQDKHDSP